MVEGEEDGEPAVKKVRGGRRKKDADQHSSLSDIIGVVGGKEGKEKVCIACKSKGHSAKSELRQVDEQFAVKFWVCEGGKRQVGINSKIRLTDIEDFEW